MDAETIQMWFNYVGVGLLALGFVVFLFGVLGVASSVSPPPTRTNFVPGSTGQRLPKKLPYVKPSDYPWYPMTGKSAPSGSLSGPEMRRKNRQIRRHNEAIDRAAGR